MTEIMPNDSGTSNPKLPRDSDGGGKEVGKPGGRSYVKKSDQVKKGIVGLPPEV